MSDGNEPQAASSTGSARLGTFSGVFTPSVLTILGIILFLRLGYVVGNGGLASALLIIGLANAISVLTSISLAAIATNLKVKGGGDYYLISRTLGVEFGGAIGTVLFLAQSVSIAFYCMGFGEAMNSILAPGFPFDGQWIAALAVLFLFVFAWLGADWGARFQYLVMLLLAAALASFFAGGMSRWDSSLILQNWSGPVGASTFWFLFALFFPAVTGFTQGVSMSGDLKDPGRSLPLGTFLAVGVSIVVYFSVAVVFSAALPPEILAGETDSMRRVASAGFLVDAGVIAATLSSAMASFLGAPRILQSLSADRVFPFLLPFAKGHGPANNPRRGVLLSTGIALLTITLGKLNVIAPVVSMFFLISYGLLNYATFYEARSLSPSFRPRFRWYDHRLSFMGWVACMGVMLAINVAAGVVAISVLFAIHQYLKRTAGPARWADSRRSYHLKRVRDHLLAAAKEPHHPRDWRPQLLAFSDDPSRRERLLRFASWLQAGSGLTTVVRILEGEGWKGAQLRDETEKELGAFIAEKGLPAFPLAVVASDLGEAIRTVLQSFGVGPIKANTVLLNWIEEPPADGIAGIRAITYSRNLRMTFRTGFNIVILHAEEEAWNRLQSLPPSELRIDVWWRDDPTSHLMLLLAYLMTRNERWEEARIRVLAVRAQGENGVVETSVKQSIKDARIDAETEVVDDATAESLAAMSKDAAVVFLPFRLKGGEIRDPFGGDLDSLLSLLPVAAVTMAAEEVDLDAEPEEGKPREIAEALDALAKAEQRLRKIEEEMSKTSRRVDEAKRKLEEIRKKTPPGADREAMERVEAAQEELEEAERAEEQENRRLAKARAKAKEAGDRAAEVGAGPAKEEEEPPGEAGGKKEGEEEGTDLPK